MRTSALWPVEEIPVFPTPDGSGSEWGYHGYRFRWGKFGLLLEGSTGWVVLAVIVDESLAIQFSVGYVAGRKLPWGTYDVLRVSEEKE